jgi:hypothetical protein
MKVMIINWSADSMMIQIEKRTLRFENVHTGDKNNAIHARVYYASFIKVDDIN